MGPIQCSRNGNKYIVVVVDLFSRWLEAGALSDTKAETLSAFLWERVISRFGPPLRIHSDKGANLSAAIIKNLYECWGINKSTTVAYHPQGNGAVERMNKVMQDMISKKLLHKCPQDWDEQIAGVVFAHNVTPHSETGLSPFSLFFGREPTIPVAGQIIKPSDCSKFEKLRSFWEKMRRRWEECHEHEKFRAGDKVLWWKPSVAAGLPRKFSLPWQGPFTVQARKNWANYLLQDPSGQTRLVHASQIKPYRMAGSSGGGSLQNPGSNGQSAAVSPSVAPRHNAVEQMESEITGGEESPQADLRPPGPQQQQPNNVSHGSDNPPQELQLPNEVKRGDITRTHQRYQFRPRVFSPRKFGW
jgi:hypothetical protein